MSPGVGMSCVLVFEYNGGAVVLAQNAITNFNSE